MKIIMPVLLVLLFSAIGFYTLSTLEQQYAEEARI